MPFLKSITFASRHGGVDALLDLIKLSNKQDALVIIGREFHLSKSQACRLRKALLEPRWIPKQGTKECIHWLIERKKENLEDIQTSASDVEKIIKKLEAA